MEIIELHFEESTKIIIDHVNSSLLKVDEEGKGRLTLLSVRLSNIAKNTRFVELANERLKDFEERLRNLGFNEIQTQEHAEIYKQRLVEFLGAGLKEYLLRQK